MTIDDFLSFIEDIIKDNSIKYTNSYIDFSVEKNICCYITSAQASPDSNSHQELPITMIIIFGKNADVAQKFVFNLFNQIYRKGKQTYNNKDFYMLINKMPQFLGRTDEGNFEYAIDLNLNF